MALTPAQEATLKTNIEADPAFNSQPHNSDGAGVIATAYNAQASPAYVIWRSNVTRNELQQLDAFDWTRFDNLSVGKARIWDKIFITTGFGNGNETIDPSKANVRAGIIQCWTGTAADNAVRDALLAAFKRNATRGEKLFATGSGTTGSPSVTAITTLISSSDVIKAMGW